VVSDAAQFLAALWPLGVPDGSQLVISTMRPGEGIRNVPVTSLDDVGACLVWREDEHVWINVAARRLGADGRGRTEDLTEIPALWADLDVSEGAPEGVHKGAAVFETFADAHAFLLGFVVRPSMIVRTGKGEGRPGDDYDEQATTESMVELLLAHGAVETHRYTKDGRLVVHLARPGKDPRQGHSLTVGYVAPAVTHMFSSGWDQLPPDTYRPYRLYARLEHGGDTHAAVRALAGQGYGLQLVALDKLPKLNGLDVARDFVAWLDGDCLFVPGIGWHVWDGARFDAGADGGGPGVARRLMTYVDALEARALVELGAADTDEGRKEAAANLKKAATWKERTPRVRILEDVADIIASSAGELDADPELLNARNGIVNLRTGELIEHDPKYRMTKIVAADYDAQATTSDWTKALDALTDDVKDWLQVAVGMGATGYASADRIFVAYGEGGGGKSTVLGTVREVLGDYGVIIPQKLFTQEGSTQVQAFMDLRGARMALAAETGEDHYLNMERLKALSGGDAITDRKLYATATVTWKPTHYLWLMTNYRPRVRNSDEGTWRRLTLIPFGQSYRSDPDESLGDRLTIASANRSAVLAWIVKGAVRWFAADQKLPRCVDVEAATETWRDDEDGMAGFIGECFEVTGSRSDAVMASEAYDTYRRYTEREGLRPLAARNLKMEMERYAERMKRAGSPFMVQGRTRKATFWYGLKAVAEESVVSTEEVPW
jgi:putative DNA primase/helicase